MDRTITDRAPPGRTYRLQISYQGERYRGWQPQNEAQEKERPSIGTLVLKAAQKALNSQDVKIHASGRTDAGVHARAQVAHLRCSSSMEPDTLLRAINSFLPKDIRIAQIEAAEKDFHAQLHAKRKTYRYFILHNRLGQQRGSWPFLYNWSWYIPQELNYELMEKSLSFLEGEHDFAGFQNAGTEVPDTVRTIGVAKFIHHQVNAPPLEQFPWMPMADSGLELLEIRVQGSGFLKQMVRNIVGTVVEIGKGKRPPEDIETILLQKDRTLGGATAPAYGLFLDSVEY